MTELQRENISRLIEQISRQSTTEDLIGFVADNFGMLRACRELLNLTATRDAAAGSWLDGECRKHGLANQVVAGECARLLALFQPESEADESYRILGLMPSASLEEVKSAYHKLSFRYHPDRAGSGAGTADDGTEKFIAISRAYKKILRDYEAPPGAASARAENTPWQPRPRPSKRPRKRRRGAFLLIGVVAALLLLFSLYVTHCYRRKVMLRCLNRNRPRPQAPIAAAPAAAALQSRVVNAAAVSAPAPTSDLAAPEPGVSLRERVGTFLTAYTQAYEKLDFTAFAGFFAEDATENDISFSRKTEKYHKLFSRLQEASYTIEPDFLRGDDHLVYVSGHFHARLLYRDGRELKLRGPTSLLLTEDKARRFKVKNLTYSFE